MDKINTYQNIIIDLLKRHAELRDESSQHIDNQLIIDREHGHFLLMNVGWNDKTPVYHTIIHIDIKDGKVWVQQDWTDAVIVDELIEMGILQQDIVLGFLAPYKRAYSGFSAA